MRAKFLDTDIISKNLLAHYKMSDETIDNSINKNHAQNIACTFVSDINSNIRSKTLYLNGKDSHLLPNRFEHRINKEFTFSCWIDTSIVAFHGLFWIGRIDGYTLLAIYYLKNGRFSVAINNNYLDVASPGGLVKFHMAITINNNLLKLYINGNLFYTRKNIPASIEITNSEKFFIGKYITGRQFKGNLDEVRFYNRELSAKEIYLIKNQI